MVTITTEIQGKVTSVATMARSINSLLVTFDVFQQYPAGYLALKHDGWRKVDNLNIDIDIPYGNRLQLTQFEFID
jgi:hypothetical protein